MNQPARSEAGSHAGRAAQTSDLALRAVRASSVIAAVCVSARGELVTANPFLLRLLGYDSVESLRNKDFKTEVLADPSDWEHWKRASATQRIAKQELNLKRADGREILLIGDIWATGAKSDAGQLLGVFADATAARQVDAAMQHAARAEAVNALTSGIVHDFNNLLTVLVGNLYLVAEGVRDDPTLFEQTKRARNVAKRGADLVRQLLTFSRNDCENEKTLDTKRLITNLEPILKHSLGSRVSLALAIEPDVASVEASAAHLESVIVNLVVNARDAIEADGEISIAAENFTLDQGEQPAAGLPPGDYVRISVTDDGCGIPETIQSRIFEPFFTTKGKTQGTGLGLSMVRRFAEQHGGTVSLDSRPGIGTTIALLLRASDSTPEDSSVMTMPLKMLPTGNEKVLVLADDSAVAETLEESLSILGYNPRVVTGQGELEQMLPLDGFSLVIIDSSFGTDPELGELVTKLASHGADSNILCVGSPPPGDADSNAAAEWLKKPFTLKDIATAMRGILDSENHA